MTDDDLCYLSAVTMARMLRDRTICARDVITAHLNRIEAYNTEVNAIVTLTADAALDEAAAADNRIARGGPVGPLHGLPVAHKDLQDTRGVRTTYGSAIYADHVPDADSLVVERMKAAGAISLGKTNTPEFGTGSQTYNMVFGPTRNPYDLTKTPGGSSGGAAAALAAGFIVLADGSDMGGSLRNPASFCNVVGLRPSPGRVPTFVGNTSWLDLAVEGPMARNVADTALLLSVLAGDDPRCPRALCGDGGEFATSLTCYLDGTRIGWARSIQGLEVDPDVTEVLETQGRPVLESLNFLVSDVHPDFTGADDAFRAWRGYSYLLSFSDILDGHRVDLNADVVANIDFGRSLTVDDLRKADVARAALWKRMEAFFHDIDFLIMPVSPVPPFEVNTRWPRSINGVQQFSYLDWMRSAYWISVTGLPAISVPCGFTRNGLPVGMQIVGPPRSELSLLRFAHAAEARLSANYVRPSFQENGPKSINDLANNQRDP